MQLRFFAIPALDPTAAETQLNALLAAARVVGVERHLVAAGAESYWAVCVSLAFPLRPELDGEVRPDRPTIMDQTWRPAGRPDAAGEPQGARGAGRQEWIFRPKAPRVAASTRVSPR